MNVKQALAKTVEHAKTKLTTTHAPVPLDIQERAVIMVSTFCL